MNCSRNNNHIMAQIYDEVAENYERYTNPLTHFKESVRNFLKENVRAGQRVLDLGCGPGHLTRDLPTDVEVVGIDISPAMVDVARRKRPSGTYLVYDFHQSLPKELGKFDIILANGCFDFCEDLNKVIINMGEVLANGGRFYFTINEYREELPFHDAHWVDIGNGPINIRMFFWTFAETNIALEMSGLKPLRYWHGPGWDSKDLRTTIYYGYWIVEHSYIKGNAIN